jgi:hypothetical protein
VSVCPFPWEVASFHDILECWEFLLKSIGHVQICLKSGTSCGDIGTSVYTVVTNTFTVALCYCSYHFVYGCYGYLGTVVNKVTHVSVVILATKKFHCTLVRAVIRLPPTYLALRTFSVWGFGSSGL